MYFVFIADLLDAVYKQFKCIRRHKKRVLYKNQSQDDQIGISSNKKYILSSSIDTIYCFSKRYIAYYFRVAQYLDLRALFKTLNVKKVLRTFSLFALLAFLSTHVEKAHYPLFVSRLSNARVSRR
jgi:hypothetical protein